LQPTLDPHSSSQAVQGFDDGAICVFSVTVDSFQLLGKLTANGKLGYYLFHTGNRDAIHYHGFMPDSNIN
jgi:hypothetical protein